MLAKPDGYAELVAWGVSLGAVMCFGVEGTGSYGTGLARFLRRGGHKVIEVSRPPRKGDRRLSGKSDPIDAEHAAREVQAGTATTTPKLADGIVEAIRLVKIARNTAVRAHTTAMITLKATLVTASDELRGELEPLSDFKPPPAPHSAPATIWPIRPRPCATCLARWLELHEETKLHLRQLKKLIKSAAPDLVAAFGA